LILIGWTSLATGCLLKVIQITTHFRPKLLGLGPLDLVLLAAVMLLFALTLAARTWVKANEPRILAERRRRGDLADPAEVAMATLADARRAGMER
jgi:hypothetical protein